MDAEQELLDRIEKARAEREAAEADASKALRLERLKAEAEAEERAANLAKAMPKLVAEHGAIGRVLEVVNTTEGAIVVKRPALPTWKKFQSDVQKDDARIDELQDKLVRGAIVYPDKIEADRILGALGGIVITLFNSIARLTGLSMQGLPGK
jgi:regulator of protease activity HflC (stomatin/prohibitin superfamily)